MTVRTPNEHNLVAVWSWSQPDTEPLPDVVAAAERAIAEIKSQAWEEGYAAGDSDRQQFESWEYVTDFGEEPPSLTPNPHAGDV